MTAVVKDIQSTSQAIILVGHFMLLVEGSFSSAYHLIDLTELKLRRSAASAATVLTKLTTLSPSTKAWSGRIGVATPPLSRQTYFESPNLR